MTTPNLPQPIERGPYTSAQNFVPARLTLAREAKGLTMRQLAEGIETTASAVSQFENGKARPSGKTILRLSLILGVPPTFFARPEPLAIEPERCHFRRRRAATQAEQRTVLARGELQLDLVNYLNCHITFLPERLRELSEGQRRDTSAEGLERLADAVRAAWELGTGPIADMVNVLERHGVMVIEVKGHTERLDAFSTWVGDWPLVFSATEKESASRRRYDLAHELAHLLLHADAKPGDPEREREADMFAGALLLPRHPFAEECPKRLVWPHLLELKRRWKVSLAALVHRAHDLGFFSTATYRRAFVQMSRLGWRRAEPAEPEMEHPTLFREALRMLAADGVAPGRIAADLGINPADIEQLIAGNSPGALSLFAS